MGTAAQIGSQTVHVDGLSIDIGTSDTSGTPPLEAIQEFKVDHQSLQRRVRPGVRRGHQRRDSIGNEHPFGPTVLAPPARRMGRHISEGRQAGTDRSRPSTGRLRWHLGRAAGPKPRVHCSRQRNRWPGSSVYINTSPVVRGSSGRTIPLTTPFDIRLPRALVRDGRQHLGVECRDAALQLSELELTPMRDARRRAALSAVACSTTRRMTSRYWTRTSSAPSASMRCARTGISTRGSGRSMGCVRAVRH